MDSLDVRLLLDFSLFLKRARKPFRFGLFSFLGVCGADPIIRLGEFCTKKNKNAEILHITFKTIVWEGMHKFRI